MILLNGQPLRLEDTPNDCEFASAFCKMTPEREILPSRMGHVCDYHYTLVYSYYEYDVEGYLGVTDYIKHVESR